MPPPLPQKVGEVQVLRGDFSKALYYRSQSSDEVERRIGYRAGRLRKGWWLLFLTEMPKTDQFEYRGYSQMSGGIAQGHLQRNLPADQRGPNAEQSLKAAGYNLTGTSYQAKGMKQKTIEDTFRLQGWQRLAKVRPVAAEFGDADTPDYPPGTGIPQWTLTHPLRWVAAAFVGPAEMYQGNYL